MPEIDILTYNTWKCEGRYPQRLDTIRQQFKEIAADIILLQEIFVSDDGKYDTLRDIYSETDDYNIIFQHARKKNRTVNEQQSNSYSGLAIASKFPFTSHGVFSLPDHPNDRHRFCQWGITTIDSIGLLVINTHLTHLQQQTLRNQQFHQLVQFCYKSGQQLAVIGGDMNASPEHYSHQQNISSCFQPPYPSTVNEEVPECIDHLYLYRSDGVNADFTNTRLLLQSNSVETRPSDHQAVISRLQIQQNGQ